MLHEPTLISASASFWRHAAAILLQNPIFGGIDQSRNLSAVRVVVPAYTHAQLLKDALQQQVGAAFVAPRIITLSDWCGLLPPEAAPPNAANARLMMLYAELRQHAWLKKLFVARRNTDLLPLAQTILTLSDELTLSLLPSIWRTSGDCAGRWQQAMGQLSPSAREILSEEAQLVWSIWKAQLDRRDALALRFGLMMRLAELAPEPMAWIAPAAPDSFEQAFLRAYSERQTVLPIFLDWRTPALAAAMASAWPELSADDVRQAIDDRPIVAPQHISLRAAHSMEQEAQFGAQSIVDWVMAGKKSIAIVAQDRIVARRLRALLERAQIFVADETGWKLSTTRAASAIAAWFDVVASRAETIALLDLLKSPFMFAERADKQTLIMTIEAKLRNANVSGGWGAAMQALAAAPAAHALLWSIAQQAAFFGGRKTIAQWGSVTEAALHAFGMWESLLHDAAGNQVVALLQAIAGECNDQKQAFSFAEWRAFVSLRLEATAYVAPAIDRRVVMLALNGTQLRSFDAVLMLGCDAEHLPSEPDQTLFFANAVRRECNLATRESRQRQQLRDFAALLCGNGEVVLSWQKHRDGEPNPASPWIERLQLALARAGAESLPIHTAQIDRQALRAATPRMPAPAAPKLLPAKISAGAYNSLVACPYQFFATRMLDLSGLDELTDMPEKRDYGDWLHQVLNRYHETIRDGQIRHADRASLLQSISADVFEREAAINAAALGYYARWKKAMPAYLAWADEHEANGWRFAFGERKFEKVLRWQQPDPSGESSGESSGEITLHGRIDRIDENDAGERAILDYKTKNAGALRDRLKQGEDRQLAFYGVLSDIPVNRASYIPLEATKGRIVGVEASNYDAGRSMLLRQIGGSMRELALGAALPATGIELVCQFCAVRGLCRKGAW